MSLDDLLPLLLVAAFVINAVLRGRRASQRGRRAPPQRRGPPAPGRATGDAAGGAPEAARPSAIGPSTEGRPAQDEMTRRLDEARRRVREAAGSASPRTEADAGSARPAAASGPGGGASGAGRPPPPTVAPATAPTVSPATPPAGFLGREGVAPSPSRTAAADGFLGREGMPRAPRTAPRRHGEAGRRPLVAASARLPAASVLGTEPEDVVRGVVWSVVLGEPVATRLRRRKVSQRRSP